MKKQCYKCKKVKDLEYEDIPQEIVEAKRQIMKLKRIIKEQE